MEQSKPLQASDVNEAEHVAAAEAASRRRRARMFSRPQVAVGALSRMRGVVSATRSQALLVGRT